MGTLKHCGSITLYTSRLILRRLELSDAESMHRNWASSVEVYKYMTSSRMPSLDDVRYFIRKKQQDYSSPELYYWGIVLPESSEVIGMVTVTEISNAQRSGNIAYALGTPWWGRGYAREAVEEVFKLMFGPVGIKKMYGCHFSENTRSGNVLKAAGMKYLGRTKDRVYHKGNFLYCENYELTSGAYHNKWRLLKKNTQPEIY